MTLTITLDKTTEQKIERKAAQLGISAEEYVQQLAIRSAHARPRPVGRNRKKKLDESPKTPAEALLHWRNFGIVGYGDQNVTAQDLALRLRRESESRHW